MRGSLFGRASAPSVQRAHPHPKTANASQSPVCMHVTLAIVRSMSHNDQEVTKLAHSPGITPPNRPRPDTLGSEQL